MPPLEKETDNNMDRISYLENTVEDLQSRFDSLKVNFNSNEERIKNLELKTQDLSIAELFKGMGGDSVGGVSDISIELIKNLEKKFDSKMKLNDEKLLKLDENNFKLTRQVQNVKNSQDLIKRNIDTIKINIEDLTNKNENLVKKLDMNYDELTERLDNKIKNLQKIINETFDYINKNSISIENKSNASDSFIKNDTKTPEKMKGDNLTNLLNRNKKFLDAIEKIKELEENIKVIQGNTTVEQIKGEIQGIKSGINNYCTMNDFKELKEKAEEMHKEIKFNKEQFEDYISDKTDHEEIQTTKRKLEICVNKTHELESVLIELIKKMDQNVSKSQEINLKSNKYLETKLFDEFKSQIIKEFSNINENFTQSRKMSEEILESLKNRTSFKDLKILEDVVLGKIEELKISSSKKFADHYETSKTFKYLEQQIKYITQVFIKKMDKGDSWLLAKKPLNSMCASCESYIGELKDTGTYIPWNKYPNKDPNDKLYRLGNGFSKMLQMIQVDENEKKSINGYQTYTDFNDIIKQINTPLKSEGNENIQKTKERLPKIKEKKKIKEPIEITDNNEMPKVNNLIGKDDSEDEINGPKITKIYRINKDGKDNN